MQVKDIQDRIPGKKLKKFYMGFPFLMIGICTINLAVGSVHINLIRGISDFFRYLIDGVSTPESIIFSLRFSRMIMSIVVGASLAAAGTAFQSVFRNPLADPYIIGASGGASLGAVLAIAMGVKINLGFVNGIGGSAFFGAMIAVVLVYTIAKLISKRNTPGIVLLTGVAVGNLISSLMALVLVTHIDNYKIGSVYFWLLGDFSGVSWAEAGSIFPVLLIGVFLIIICARPLDLLAIGYDEAATSGLDPRFARMIACGGAALATAGSVSAVGTIGFVGLMAPHIARAFVGSENRKVIPAAMISGALLMMLADMAARTLFSPIEVPVGIFTAVIGTPFFIFLLVRSAKRGVE